MVFRERIERMANHSLTDQLERRAAHVAAHIDLGGTILDQRSDAVGELAA